MEFLICCDEFVLSPAQLLPAVFSQAGQHKVMSLNKSFLHFQSVLTVFSLSNGHKMFPAIIQQLEELLQTSHWLLTRQAHVSYQVWGSVDQSQRSGLLILGNGQLSSRTIFGVLYFPSFYCNSPLSSSYRAQGPLLFESFPTGPLRSFKDSAQRPPSSPSSAAVLHGNISSPQLCHITVMIQSFRPLQLFWGSSGLIIIAKQP